MTTRTAWPDRRAIWRWHFYAGLICAPIVLWLAVTGSIYLFRAQIEAAIDAPYAQLEVKSLRPPSEQVQAALASSYGSQLSAYILPQDQRAATQILIEKGGEKTRVYVHPETLEVVKSVKENDRFMRQIFRLHGELMIGDPGSWIVETAACWAIVLILTGLVLWWPSAGRFAGVLWPRLGLGGRVFWRDMHAVTGFWVSACALFLICTGLPWAKFWGDYFKEVRQITRTVDGPQDWANSAPSRAAPASAAHDEHHDMGHMQSSAPKLTGTLDPAALDRVVAAAQKLEFAPPVVVSPPPKGGGWKVRSDAANRPLRADAKIDALSGAVLSLRSFDQRHPIDQAVGYGVAAHEGQLFGPANLLVSLLTAIGLMVLCVSAMMTWLSRRPPSVLGAPEMLERPRFSFALLAALATLAVLFPLHGASLLVVLLVERLILRRVPSVRRWLGLQEPARATA
ncbi:MAG: PepSY-associated TM helix domain-containing protein [Caulobacterales bacterium]